MPCYHPVQAYRPRGGGSVIFADRGDCDPVTIPCRQCIGCRLERSRSWAVRCMHEAQMHDENCFLTLTYSEDNLPARGQLVYDHFQRFMKRLRKFADPATVRFFMCGEYGELNWRPHFHACIFGFDFADKVPFRITGSQDQLFQSASLSRLWPYGFASIGNVTFNSAGYVARYCVKKVTGFNADAHYARCDSDGPFQLEPEFAHMSLKPGIGASWLEKYSAEVFPSDFVVVRGVQCRVPRYYDNLLEVTDPFLFDDVKWNRELDARSRLDDNTDARLAAKETVHAARLSLLYRSSI